jgi:6,7-dimethyl-8-ribityllumazine synthase
MMTRPPDAPVSILIVEGRFYDDVCDALLAGATAAIKQAGATFERITVPGALEIPPAVMLAHRAGLLPWHGGRRGFDGCVALGCVIRGETSHYDVVAGESARALMDIALTQAIPIGNGILSVDTHTQAMERALPDRRNKGGAAAEACLRLIAVAKTFQGTS